MYLISLRGNLNGVDESKENKPYHISELLKDGYHCWVDVWWKDDAFYLGKDEPKYLVKNTFLNMFSLWCNAKDFTTYLRLIDIKTPHPFYYTDAPTLCYNGDIITSEYFEGRERNTVLITDDTIYSQMNLKGIVSPNISDFK
jgi:hypothetical protein